MIRCRNEEGAVAITTALLLIVLILLASFLVDLGSTRADARADQLLSDAAVMAAAHTDGTVVEQCKAAVAFYAANISAGPVDDSPCDSLGVTIPCTDDPPTPTPPETTPPITIGDFTMVVTHPVPNDDPAMEVQEVESTHDARPCSRIKVEVTRTRDFVFGPAGGVSGSGSSVNDAVAIRLMPGEPDVFASLIVMEPEACLVLDATGGADIQVVDGDPYPVDHDNDPATPDIMVTPEGIITVDTLATGGTGSENCNTGGTLAIIAPASGCISATGTIFSYGLLDGNPAKVYDPAHVGPDPCNTGDRLTPEPIPGNVIGRRQVDWRFNCLASYPSAGNTGDQRYPAAEHTGPGRHEPCTKTDSLPPFIDELHAELKAGEDIFVENQFYPITGGTCPDIEYDGADLYLNGTAVSPAPPTNRLWIRCEFGSNYTLDLQDVEYVVFDKEIDKDPTIMRIHGPSGVGAVAYFRSSTSEPDGGFEANGGVIDLQDTFVYVDSRGARNQDVPITVAGNATLTWLGQELTPAEAQAGMKATCQPYATAYTDGDPLTVPSDLPPPGCFAPLALWSNSLREHSLAGSGGITVRGSFFTPNAVQKIAGGAGFDFINSQFFANYLRTTGGGTIELKPNPSTNIPVDPPAPGLIR